MNSPGPIDDSIVIPSALNVVAGVWFLFSPFLLGYRPGDPYLNEMVTGALIAVLSYLRAVRAARSPFLSWCNVLLGGWALTSAFLLFSSVTADLNEAITGSFVLVLALSSALSTQEFS